MTSFLRAAAGVALGVFAFCGAAAAGSPDLSLQKEVDDYLLEAEGASNGNPGAVTWEFKGGLRWKTADGAFEGKIGGRLMFDWKWITSDDFDSDVTADGGFLRRCRLAMDGTIYHNSEFKLEVDFAGGPSSAPDPKDVYVGLKKLPLHAHLRMGHFKEPFSLEELTGANQDSFIEQASPTNAFAPSRNLGFMIEHVLTEAKRISLAYGLFREVDDDIQIMEDGEYAFTVRVCAWLLEDEETNRVLHVGFGFSLRDPPGESVRYRVRPGVNMGERLVDTNTVAADDVTLFNFEILFTWKGFHFQAEFIAADVDGGSAGANPMFSGFYVELGYFLTGESRAYDKKKFSCGFTKPRRNFHDGGGGRGAVQIVFRYDTLDLDDDGVLGGTQDSFTVGVNWHWNPNTRVMFNVIFVDVEQGAGGSFDGSETLFVMRLQLHF
jgi:phosphate-selective porin OprO/OprP